MAPSTYAPLSTCTELHLSGKFLSLSLEQSELRSSRLPAKFLCSKRVTWGQRGHRLHSILCVCVWGEGPEITWKLWESISVCCDLLDNSTSYWLETLTLANQLFISSQKYHILYNCHGFDHLTFNFPTKRCCQIQQWSSYLILVLHCYSVVGVMINPQYKFMVNIRHCWVKRFKSTIHNP